MKTPEEIAGDIINNFVVGAKDDKWPRLKERIAKAIRDERLAVCQHTCIHHGDAQREAADKECPVCHHTRVKALEDGLMALLDDVTSSYRRNLKNGEVWLYCGTVWPNEVELFRALLADTKEGETT